MSEDRIVHVFGVRIYYEDTDFSGVVYHANYLRFMERGRSEYLRTLGIGHRALFEGGTHAGFVVRSLEMEFLAPARMDDLVTVETRVVDVRGASALMNQRVLRNDTTLVTARVRVATVTAGRVVRFPQPVRDALMSEREP